MKRREMLRICGLGTLGASLPGLAWGCDSTTNAKKKIALIAGPKSHGYGAHEPATSINNRVRRATGGGRQNANDSDRPDNVLHLTAPSPPAERRRSEWQRDASRRG